MKKFLMMFSVALALVLQACNNNDDLWNAIDDLKGRVQALESQVKDLNRNLDALRELYSGKTISEVTLVGGKYVLKLSDGTIIELTQGSAANAVIPVVTIDKDGYWQVSYDGGKTFQSLEVKATASDGVTPQFRIDEANGYWQVSYDKGKTFENVLDTKGQPVKAVDMGKVTDKFFEDVQVKGDMFYIKLLDGTEMNIPILKDFLCAIHTDTEGAQSFFGGETKTFRVELKGADNTILSAPDGWQASLSTPVNNEAQLRVTAPLSTRATADNTKDVSILITSNSYASISKIQVELSGEAPVPMATVANSTTTLPTQTTLSFVVTTTNAEGWKYICQKSTVTAPDAAKVFADGTAGSGTSVTVSALEAGTKYTIYVVAYKADKTSTLQSVENTTVRAAIDYYQAGYTVDGVTYSKDTPGVQLLTDAGSITAAGVYFLAPTDETVVFTLSKLAAAQLVIIGRYEGAQPKLTISGIQSFNGASGTGYIFKNLDITGATDNYIFNFGGTAGTYSNFVIEDCNLLQTKGNGSVTYFNNANSAIANTTVRNSRIGVTANADAAAMRVLNFNAVKPALMESIVFENSIIYAPQYVANGTLIFLPTSGASTTGLNVVVDNNTFVDFVGQPNGLINLTGDRALSIQKNIFWASPTFKTTAYLLKFAVTTTAPPMTIAQNIFFGLTTETSWAAYHPGSSYKTEETFSRESVDPFDGGTFNLATGTFIPGSAYAGYGSSLK